MGAPAPGAPMLPMPVLNNESKAAFGFSLSVLKFIQLLGGGLWIVLLTHNSPPTKNETLCDNVTNKINNIQIALQ